MNSFIRRLLCRFSALLFFVFCSNFAFAQSYLDFGDFTFPSIEPSFTQEDFFGQKLDQTLDADQTFLLALLFSECTPDSKEWNFCMEKYKALKEVACSKEYMKMPFEERGRAILKLLYRDTLKKYNINQTKITDALRHGNYNCVSSAVLYMSLAKAAGLTVKGQKTPAHAFCTVYFNDGGKVKKIDVETTNPYGFDPGSKETIENESKIKRYYVVPKKNYANRQEVSDKIFTGLIAGNLCADYIKKNDYISSVPLGAARYALVQDENSSVVAEIRNDFDILACNNISFKPSSAYEYAGLMIWFADFIDKWGMTDYIQKSVDSGCNNLFVLCYEEKDYELAKQGYQRLSPYLSKKQKDNLEGKLADIMLIQIIEGLSDEEQIPILKELLERDEFKDPAWRAEAKIALENAWIKILNNHMRTKTFEEGYVQSKLALEELGGSDTIKRMNQNFYSNCIATIHNQFAKEANRQNYKKAVQILQDGLEKFPNDKTLSKDLAEMKKILKE